MRLAVLAALLLSACDSNSSYPFVGKWALENPRPRDLCSFIPTARITRTHILGPLTELTVTDIKHDSGRWILSVTGGAQVQAVVIKDVSAQSLVLGDMMGLWACKMKKTGECKNLLCD